MNKHFSTVLVIGCLVGVPWAFSVGQETSPGGSPGQENLVSPELDSILRHRAWHHEFVPASTLGPARSPGLAIEPPPVGGTFQNANPRHITARIGGGGQPDRNEQLRSQAIGIQRYNAIQTHIDNYGRPLGGFGMGFGFGFPM